MTDIINFEFVDEPNKSSCAFCNRKIEEAGPFVRQVGKIHANICSECARLAVNIIDIKLGLDYFEEEAEEDIENKLANVTSKMEARRKDFLQKLPDDNQAVAASPAPICLSNKSRYDFSIFPKPVDLKMALDKYVISQETAKKNTATAIYNHFIRINRMKKTDDDVEIQKSNILYLGPTGSGKTYTAQTVAKLLHIPFVSVDANTYTEAGYHGDDVENILSGLLMDAEGDKGAAEKGIVFVDELDKIGKRPDERGDVSREAVQRALLKMIEGTKISVPKSLIKKSKADELVEIDTTNILFIFGGAFVGLSEIIKNRIGKKTIGFGSNSTTKPNEYDLLNKVTSEDLIKFGLIPEFIGRVPINIIFEELTRNDLLRILVEPKNAITKQYQALLSENKVDLCFTDEALSVIAAKAIKEKSGARGLRKIMESFMQNIMYEVPSAVGASQCIVSAETVQTGKYDLKFHEESISLEK